MIEIIKIESRDQWLAARKQDVTASVVGALLGVHDYQTAYGLHMLKAGLVVEDPEETPAMKRGRLLEPVIGQLIHETFPDLAIAPSQNYFRDPTIRLGATPDFVGLNGDGPCVIQTKSVAPSVFRSKWIDPDTKEVTPPLWIVAQAMVEAHLTGAHWAAVAAMVVDFGLDLHFIRIPIHARLIERIRAEVVAFWERVEAGTPPDPDYARDGKLLASIYADTDGSTVALEGTPRVMEMLERRAALKAREADGSAAEKERRVIDTELVAMLGNAEVGRLPNGATISAKTTRRGAYEVKATSFRTVRIAGFTPSQVGAKTTALVAAEFPESF